MKREFIDQPSPNFDERRPDDNIRYLILHYTGMASGKDALARLVDPDAKVSAHYLIEENGDIFRLVSEEKRAWHAGVSSWEGQTDINSLSIGIELVNPGHDYPGYKGDYRPFPAPQMESLARLAGDIVRRHRIRAWHVLGHSDVAPGRKIDPGELFNWRWLAGQGIGIWPVQGDVTEMPDISSLQEMLVAYGYGLEVTGELDENTRCVLSAFQRHFRPADFSGHPDLETCDRIKQLLLEKNKSA